MKLKRGRFKTSSLLAVWSLLIWLSPEYGSSQTPFYQGKVINVVRGGEPGGVGEMRTRAVVAYLQKHIPGNPAIKIEFMPGAGGRKAANHIYGGARPDGLTIGSAPGGMVSSAVLGEPGVEYDLNKFIYLGSPNSTTHYVFFTNRKLGLDNLGKLRSASGIRLGAQTVGHPVYYNIRLFAFLLDLKEPKFVTGYSAPEIDLALLRGELDAALSVASSVVQRTPEFIEKGLMDFHAIIEIPRGDKHPRFVHLPEIESFAKTDRERKLLAMHRTFRLAGSPFILPPATPRERVEILQEAMRKVFKDPEFSKDFRKLTGEDPTPLVPEAHEKAIRELPREREIVDLYRLFGGSEPLPRRRAD